MRNRLARSVSLEPMRSAKRVVRAGLRRGSDSFALPLTSGASAIRRGRRRRGKAHSSSWPVALSAVAEIERAVFVSVRMCELGRTAAVASTASPFAGAAPSSTSRCTVAPSSATPCGRRTSAERRLAASVVSRATPARVARTVATPARSSARSIRSAWAASSKPTARTTGACRSMPSVRSSRVSLPARSRAVTTIACAPSVVSSNVPSAPSGVVVPSMATVTPATPAAASTACGVTCCGADDHAIPFASWTLGASSSQRISRVERAQWATLSHSSTVSAYGPATPNDRAGRLTVGGFAPRVVRQVSVPSGPRRIAVPAETSSSLGSATVTASGACPNQPSRSAATASGVRTGAAGLWVFVSKARAACWLIPPADVPRTVTVCIPSARAVRPPIVAVPARCPPHAQTLSQESLDKVAASDPSRTTST